MNNIIPPIEPRLNIELPVSNVLAEMVNGDTSTIGQILDMPDDLPEAEIIQPAGRPPKERPHPMGYKERKQWGISLRIQATNFIALADRIDPEHRGLITIDGSTVTDLQNELVEWKKLYEDLEAKNAALASVLTNIRSMIPQTLGQGQ